MSRDRGLGRFWGRGLRCPRPGSPQPRPCPRIGSTWCPAPSGPGAGARSAELGAVGPGPGRARAGAVGPAEAPPGLGPGPGRARDGAATAPGERRSSAEGLAACWGRLAGEDPGEDGLAKGVCRSRRVSPTSFESNRLCPSQGGGARLRHGGCVSFWDDTRPWQPQGAPLPWGPRLWALSAPFQETVTVVALWLGATMALCVHVRVCMPACVRACVCFSFGSMLSVPCPL